MESTPREVLSNDHHEVGDVLNQLLAALDDNDVQASYAKLDLLWARLAVHIRAEHLHLFPAVLNSLRGSSKEAAVPDFSAAESTVESLRGDHDFFMRELAGAVGVLRELPTSLDGRDAATRLTSVLDVVLEVKKRLESHNEVEENQIYHWAGTMLPETDQIDLAARINAELEHRPPRFSVEAWANDHD